MIDDNSATMYAEDAGLTARDQMDPEQPIKKIQLIDNDGNPIRFSSGAGQPGAAGAPGTSYTLPAATTAALGGVKKATAVADPTASTIGTVTALDGETVTVANVNQVITSLNTTIGALNDVVTKQKQLLANLRTAGVIEQS